MSPTLEERLAEALKESSPSKLARARTAAEIERLARVRARRRRGSYVAVTVLAVAALTSGVLVSQLGSGREPSAGVTHTPSPRQTSSIPLSIGPAPPDPYMTIQSPLVSHPPRQIQLNWKVGEPLTIRAVLHRPEGSERIAWAQFVVGVPGPLNEIPYPKGEVARQPAASNRLVGSAAHSGATLTMHWSPRLPGTYHLWDLYRFGRGGAAQGDLGTITVSGPIATCAGLTLTLEESEGAQPIQVHREKPYPVVLAPQQVARLRAAGPCSHYVSFRWTSRTNDVVENSSSLEIVGYRPGTVVVDFGFPACTGQDHVCSGPSLLGRVRVHVT